MKTPYEKLKLSLKKKKEYLTELGYGPGWNPREWCKYGTDNPYPPSSPPGELFDSLVRKEISKRMILRNMETQDEHNGEFTQTGIRIGWNGGKEIWFRIDNQTFYLEEMLDNGDNDLDERVKWMQRQLNTAMEKLKNLPPIPKQNYEDEF